MSNKEDVVFGEIDWNSGDVGSGGGGKIEFLRLEQGTTTVRVMGNPHQFYIHWVDLQDGSKRKVSSPIGAPDVLRQLEDAGFKRKPRWLVKVLDRSDDKFKLLEIGSQIYNGIRALFNNPKWGKVTEYDVDIIRAKPGTNPLYAVQPNPKEKLDASFKESFTEFNDAVNIDALTKPALPEEVMRLMGWDSEASVAPTGSAAGKGKVMSASEDSDDDDGGFQFE